MKCYLAHPVTEYGGTPRQLEAIEAIEAKDWEVVNPDKPWHQEGYRQHGMGYFLELVEDCDKLAFMRFPDGTIGAGVAKEIEKALQRRLMIYDVSRGDLFPCNDMMPGRVLSVEATREKIAKLRSSPLSSHDRNTGDQNG